MKTIQLFELIITSLLFAFMVSNLVEVLKPDLWLVSTLVSFSSWFVIGIRYYYLKNEMLKYKPNETVR